MSNRPVFHFINCIKHFQRSLVVSHNDHSRTMLAGDIAEELHHLPTTMAVQCSGGFVSENYARMVGQSSGDGNSLLLSARQHGCAVIEAVSNSRFIQKFGGSLTGLDLLQSRRLREGSVPK